METYLEKSIKEGIQALQEQQYGKADSVLRQALQNAESADNAVLIATCLDGLGETYFRQGRFDQAEPYFEKAFAMRRKSLPPAHEDLVASLNSLSATYFFQRKYSMAKPLCEQLLATYELLLGKHHPEVATCLINLGLIAMSENKFGDAEQYFAEASRIRRAFYEPAHILIGNSLSHLGNTYFEQKRYDRANETFKEAFDILEKYHDLNNSDLQAIVQRLAHSYEQVGKLEDLEKLYIKMIRSSELKIGPGSQQAGKYLEKLAHLHLSRKKFEAAEKIFQRLLSMRRHVFGETHPEVAIQLSNLAHVKQASGQSMQAENLFLRALNIYENYKYKSGSTTVLPSYLATLRSLADFYFVDRRYAKAEKQFQQLIDMLEPQNKTNPALLVDLYEHVAICFKEQDKMQDAHKTLAKALDTLANNIGKIKEIDYKLYEARILTQLADLQKKENNVEEAEANYQNALEILTKFAGPSNPALAPTLQAYADLLMQTYREQEAEHMLTCARSLNTQ